ncbi:MAG UNVERIFIED_CONTAM: hypothetical protein LVT10_15025 [Anaerolineae bacterium]
MSVRLNIRFKTTVCQQLVGRQHRRSIAQHRIARSVDREIGLNNPVDPSVAFPVGNDTIVTLTTAVPDI